MGVALATEWRNSDEGQEMGHPDPEADFQTEDEGGGRVGVCGIQEEDFEGNDGQVEEDEIADG